MIKKDFPISRKPLFDLSGFAMSGILGSSWSEGLGRGRYVTSGRAAIFHALRLLGVGSGDAVLVPAYHCPTLVAPVVVLGAEPIFYPLTEMRLPDLEVIRKMELGGARAIVVPQLFGLPVDLAETREWCDDRAIPIVEDCAHSIVGRAGSRRVGDWGDFATASLTKFMPVRELGYLSSSSHTIPTLALTRASIRAELKGVLDPIQIAAEHGRLGPIGAAIREFVRYRNGSAVDISGFPQSAGESAGAKDWTVDSALSDCDMARVCQSPSMASRIVAALSSLPVIACNRRRNFARMARLVDDFSIGRLPFLSAPVDSAPYVLPVFVDEPEPLYAAMRTAGFPVFRWDRVWPGTPAFAGSGSSSWSRCLLQVPVHQSLSDRDFDKIESILQGLVSRMGKALGI